jgi:hypothetical protein
VRFLKKDGQTWSKMVKPGQRWSNLVKDGQIWSNLVKHGRFQIFGELCGQSSPAKIIYAKVYLENLNFMCDNHNLFSGVALAGFNHLYRASCCLEVSALAMDRRLLSSVGI